MTTSAKVPPGLSPSLLKREQTQDELRKAFEAELQSGKHRLRNVPGGVQVMPTQGGGGGGGSAGDSDSDDGVPRPPVPAPVLPENRIITFSGRIPEAPKLPGKLLSKRPTVVPKSGKTQQPVQSSKSFPEMSQREALLTAIRKKGGVQGLRKVSTLGWKGSIKICMQADGADIGLAEKPTE